MNLDSFFALAPLAQAAIIFLLVLLATGGLCWAIFAPALSHRTAAVQRLELLAGFEQATAGGPTTMAESRRKQSIEKALSEMADRERAKQRAKMTLKMRLSQAGLDWTPASFYLRAAGIGFGVFVVTLGLMKMAIYFAVPVAVAAGVVGANLLVKQKRNQRMRRFLEEFPNAIDVVTRGVKTGLPLGDCLRAIANEGQEPVRTEFQHIIEDLSVGLPMQQALLRFTHRVPIMEANFFAVVVAIQGQLGGNLSEALGNLSRVLRERKMMKQKIKAFSSEATASGAIIASMPVVVSGVLSITSPDYIALMFSEFIGNVVLVFCVFWMITGVIVMRNMIRFDF